MAEDEKQENAKNVISQVGKRLTDAVTCPNKSVLVKLLKQAADAFLVLKRSEPLEKSVKALGDSLIRHCLLDHKDKDVRLLVGICLCGVLRVLAPNTGFSEEVSRDIFRFLLSIFEELDDTASPFFSKKAKLLETIAKLKFCLVMLDIGCEDLVIKMFKIFFNVVRENHPQSLISSILSIITSILEGKVQADTGPLEKNIFQSLLDVVLQNIVKGKKNAVSASFQLAVSVIQNCGEKVERCIYQLLRSCILDRDAVQSAIKESYHEIILEVYQIAPHLSLSVIPLLTDELLTYQVDVRIKVLNLIRKLLSLHGQNFSRKYPSVFIEFLNRFSDKSAEVRLTALSCAKALYTTIPSHIEPLESAIKGRLLDHDDKVRMEAVNVVCEIAKTNSNRDSPDLIMKAAERLRDKKMSVRNRTLQKLVELYQEYCTRHAAGITSFSEHIEEIPCRLLMLCYEKDCQEFRPQSMELVLADLFPACLSMKERTRHWIYLFSRFEPPHFKALKAILSQKRRVQDGLNVYFNLCNCGEDICSGEIERKLEALVVKMSSCFPNPTKAKDCFHKLKEFRDKGVFRVLQQFLSEGKMIDSDTMKDVYLRELGQLDALPEFLHILSRKCAFNIFGCENVRYILDFLSSDDAEVRNLKNYQVQLLLTIISAFPSLLRGSEPQFQLLLLEREIPFNEQLIEMFAREGNHMPIKLSDVYSSLEKVCIEGTRAQSKLAVSAISALADTPEQFIFSELCKELVDSLCSRQNVPTVLQSLGCIAQYSSSTFESHEKRITKYIVEDIFQHNNDALASKDIDISDETSTCCGSCELKVFGLKLLVKSFLPHKHTCLSRPISFLLDIIQKMLQNQRFCEVSIPCERDEAFIRLAAAKSVLRLSRKWDLHISPTIFHLTILMAKDSFPETRRSFTRKLRKLLMNHALPGRYACAFTFVALDPLEDLRTDALNYLEEYIRAYSKAVQIHVTTTMEGTTNHPVYLAVFLIHVLAHDPSFPAPDCQDEDIHARFLSPLFIAVQALVKENLAEASIYLRGIFKAIKKAKDAVNAQMTPKLHLLAKAGLCILDSLNTNTLPLIHTPTFVMLPSSLYRNGYDEMSEASPYPSIGSIADACFSKNLVSRTKAHVSGIGCTGSKHSKKIYENFLQPCGIRQGKSSSKFGSDNLINLSKEKIVKLPLGQEQSKLSTCEVGTRGEQNLATSGHLGSVVLGNKLCAEDKVITDGCINLGAKSSFLDDSVTKPLLPQNEIVIPRKEDIVNLSGLICAEPSRSLKVPERVKNFPSKNKPNIKSNGNELVGKFWSPIEKCYNSGVVDSFDFSKSTHQDLDDPRARAGDDIGDSLANVEAKTLDACAQDTEQENSLNQRDTCIKNASEAAKKTRRRDDTIGKPVLPTRRSQRRKI